MCLPCQQRCKKCVNLLNLQGQECVNECEFPFFGGEMHCEYPYSFQKFGIKHVSRMRKHVVNLQSIEENLIVQLQWDNALTFNSEWRVKTLSPEVREV